MYSEGYVGVGGGSKVELRGGEELYIGNLVRVPVVVERGVGQVWNKE